MGKLHILTVSPRVMNNENDKYNKVADKEDNFVKESEDVRMNPQLEVIETDVKLVEEDILNKKEKGKISDKEFINNDVEDLSRKTSEGKIETKKIEEKKDENKQISGNNQNISVPLVKKEENIEKIPINTNNPSVKKEEKKENIDKTPIIIPSNPTVKKEEKKETPIKKKPQNEPSNIDGITIDNSDNLPNFDEGNESPDSDT